MSKNGILLGLAVFLLCSGMTAWAEEESSPGMASERLVAHIDFSSWEPNSFTVSPDSTRVAYPARIGNKWFVVVDGKEEKQYDGIINLGGGKILFDSADSLHYLALKGSSIYLVEERIKRERN